MAFVLVHLNVIFLLCRLTNAVHLQFHKLVSWLACNCKMALYCPGVYLSVSVCTFFCLIWNGNGLADFDEIWRVGPS